MLVEIKKIRQAPQKKGGEVLFDPGWCVHKSDVQNKWNDDTRTLTGHQLTNTRETGSVVPLRVRPLMFHTC